MSWLSHFTNWVGEQKNTILPIVTGVAGFAAGMIPGIGGTAQKMIDKFGNKITGAVDTLEGINSQVQLPDNPAAPTAPAVVAVAAPKDPTSGGADGATSAPARGAKATGTNPALYIGLGVAALLLFGRK